MFNFKENILFRINSSWLLLISSIFIIVFDNTLFWSKFAKVVSGSLLDKPYLYWVFAITFVFILFLIMALFSVKKSTKFVVISLLILSSALSYFLNNYGVIISDSMIQNVLETDTNEAFDLLSFSLLQHVFLFGILPSIVVYFIPLKEQSFLGEIKSRLLTLLIVFIITISSVYISLKEVTFIGRENKPLRSYINPIYPISSVYKHFKKSLKTKDKPIDKVFSDAIQVKNVNKNTVLVLVVGETARASSFALNGYTRNTTPLLSKKNIINYTNTSSCGTATAESVPCMFSAVTRDDFDLQAIKQQENLLDALEYAGINVVWQDNNSGCKGVCDRAKIPIELMHVTGSAEFCVNHKCYDEVLVQNLALQIKNINQDTVIILHTQGSHGPAYYKRVPEKFVKFKPECKSKALHNCSNEEIVNSYDNTILYTDYILSEVIDVLKANTNVVNSAMIYMSDHGESLGEDGVYLHGLPYFMAPDFQTHIPFIIWLSENIKSDLKISASCLENNSDKNYSHDNLVHSVLGLMNVNASRYKNKLDIFSPCRNNL